jgi:acyl-CoA thioesterase-1
MQGDHRICFFGDSFVHGTTDLQCRGWVGRVCEAARARGFDVSAYNLGVRRETSRDVRARWEAEAALRFRAPCTTYVVFAFGGNDMTFENGAPRVDFDESVENLRAVVTSARRQHKVLVLGPGPVNEVEQDERIVQLCDRYAEAAAQLDVPYLPVVRSLMADERWRADVAAADGCHPANIGYDVYASLVLAWPAWWFR